MNLSNKQIKKNSSNLQELRLKFIISNVPRLHRLLMEQFPGLKKWFNYSIAENNDDPTKLTLLRGSGKKMRVIARNFLP